MIRRVGHLIRSRVGTARLSQALTFSRQGAWSSAEYLFFPLLMLIAVPVFLKSLGAEQYGRWMLLTALSSMVGWAGLGMGAATIREVAAARGRGDDAAAARCVGVAMLIVLVCSVVAGSFLLVGFLIGGHHLLAKMGGTQELLPIIVGAVFMIAADQMDSVYAGALRGSERFDLAASVEIGARLSIVAGTIVAALLSERLDIVIAVGVVLNLGRVLLKATAVSSLLGGRAWIPAWDLGIATKLVRFGKWSFLQLIGSAVFSTADRLVIGSILGADALARYSICLQLAQQVQSIPAAFGSFLFPYFTRNAAAASAERNRWSLTIATSALTILSLCIAAPLVFLARPILDFWVGPDISSQGADLLGWLAAAHCVLALSVAAHYFLYGAGLAQWVALSNVVAGSASLAAVVALVPVMGPFGAVFSRCLYGVILLLSYALKLVR